MYEMYKAFGVYFIGKRWKSSTFEGGTPSPIKITPWTLSPHPLLHPTPNISKNTCSSEISFPNTATDEMQVLFYLINKSCNIVPTEMSFIQIN